MLVARLGLIIALSSLAACSGGGTLGGLSGRAKSDEAPKPDDEQVDDENEKADKPGMVAGSFLTLACGGAAPVAGTTVAKDEGIYGCVVMDSAGKRPAKSISFTSIDVVAKSGAMSTPKLTTGPKGSAWDVLFSLPETVWATVGKVDAVATVDGESVELSDPKPGDDERCADGSVYSRADRTCIALVEIRLLAKLAGDDFMLIPSSGLVPEGWTVKEEEGFRALPPRDCPESGCALVDDPRFLAIARLYSQSLDVHFQCQEGAPEFDEADSGDFDFERVEFRGFQPDAFPGTVGITRYRHDTEKAHYYSRTGQNLPTDYRVEQVMMHAFPP